MLYLKHNFILAFPGMGKTPLSSKLPDYVDADFGNYRELMGVSKDEEVKLLRPFSMFMRSLGNLNILTNEPKLVRFVPFNRMYLPTPSAYHYNAKKMGVSVEQIAEWVQGWAETARDYNIPVTYLSIGLDEYIIKEKYITDQLKSQR